MCRFLSSMCRIKRNSITFPFHPRERRKEKIKYKSPENNKTFFSIFFSSHTAEAYLCALYNCYSRTHKWTLRTFLLIRLLVVPPCSIQSSSFFFFILTLSFNLIFYCTNSCSLIHSQKLFLCKLKCAGAWNWTFGHWIREKPTVWWSMKVCIVSMNVNWIIYWREHVPIFDRRLMPKQTYFEMDYYWCSKN